MEIGSGPINNLFNFPYDLDDDNGYFMENGVNEINCMICYKEIKFLQYQREEIKGSGNEFIIFIIVVFILLNFNCS